MTILLVVPLSTDDVLLRARDARAICGQVDSFNESIREYDRLIEQLVKQHTDYEVVSTWPCQVPHPGRVGR